MDSITEMFEEAPPTMRTGVSLDEMVHEFIRLDRLVKESAAERAEYAHLLADKARDQQNGQNTVHLQSSAGSRIKVEFKHEQSCDQVEIESAKDVLDDDKVFYGLFRAKYAPKAKNLKTFLNTAFSDERTMTAQQIIREAVKDVERSPAVTIEKV